MEADFEVMCVLAKECQHPVEAGRGEKKGSPLEPPEGVRACPHPDFELLASTTAKE